MGIIIKSDISTNKGTTNSAYLNIKKVTFRKGDGVFTQIDSLDIDVNLYLSKSDRELSPLTKVISASVPRYFGAADIGSPGYLQDLSGSSNMFEVAYAKIKDKLSEGGLITEDDI